MNRRIVARLTAYIIFIEMAAMIPPLLISLFGKEWNSVRGLAVAMAAGCLCAGLLMLLRPQSKAFYAAEGFVTTALSWVVISLFGALPFWVSGTISNPVDCFFEIVSGFTTTGASILQDVECLPRGLLYWRSFTHWLGGMGVLVFLLAVISYANKGDGNSIHLLKAESPGPIVGKLAPKIRSSAKILYGIYIALSVLMVILLLCGGMPLFDSLCAMFGAAGTGGFGIKNSSMAAYSPYCQTIVTIFMALFGVNFNIFYLLLIRDFSRVWRDEELRVYLGIMLSSILLISVNILPLYSGLGEAFHHAAFQVSSIMTTTGFATVDFNQWPEFSRAILVLLMIVGASAGSTGGGMKAARIVIAFKSVRKEISRMLHPRAVKVVQMDGQPLDNRVTKGVSVFMTVYFATVAVSFLLVSLDGCSTVTNITAVLACVNNIGPGLDLVGPMGNYSHFSNLSKLILAFNMLLGRLEFFPILILLTPSTWRKKK